MIAGLGNAQWPVIDISAVAQLVETVRLVQDQLTEMTTAKEALLGQVANYTGIWDDLTGDAYSLGEQTGAIVNTARSLTDIDTELLNRRNREQLAWPTLSDVQRAHAGADPAVITSVLTAHQARSQKWNDQRAAWYDMQIMLASTGQFLEEVETTASTQNSTTDPGLSAQLDRQIAVALRPATSPPGNSKSPPRPSTAPPSSITSRPWIGPGGNSRSSTSEPRSATR